MPKFRKKPVVIEAEQFQPGTWKDRRNAHWPEGVEKDERSPTGFSMPTLENTLQRFEVTPGDWIITGVKGERYACKPDIFEATYDPIEEGDD